MPGIPPQLACFVRTMLSLVQGHAVHVRIRRKKDLQPRQRKRQTHRLLTPGKRQRLPRLRQPLLDDDQRADPSLSISGTPVTSTITSRSNSLNACTNARRNSPTDNSSSTPRAATISRPPRRKVSTEKSCSGDPSGAG